MKSSLYFAGIFCLALGLTGCAEGLSGPSVDIDSSSDSPGMAKVLERDSFNGSDMSSPMDWLPSDSSSTASDSTISPLYPYSFGRK